MWVGLCVAQKSSVYLHCSGLYEYRLNLMIENQRRRQAMRIQSAAWPFFYGKMRAHKSTATPHIITVPRGQQIRVHLCRRVTNHCCFVEGNRSKKCRKSINVRNRTENSRWLLCLMAIVIVDFHNFGLFTVWMVFWRECSTHVHFIFPLSVFLYTLFLHVHQENWTKTKSRTNMRLAIERWFDVLLHKCACAHLLIG